MNALRQARKEAGLTQKEMAERFEIPIRTIEDWEAEKRTPPAYVEKLILEKLTQIKEQKNEKLEGNQ